MDGMGAQLLPWNRACKACAAVMGAGLAATEFSVKTGRIGTDCGGAARGGAANDGLLEIMGDMDPVLARGVAYTGARDEVAVVTNCDGCEPRLFRWYTLFGLLDTLGVTDGGKYDPLAEGSGGGMLVVVVATAVVGTEAVMDVDCRWEAAFLLVLLLLLGTLATPHFSRALRSYSSNA